MKGGHKNTTPKMFVGNQIRGLDHIYHKQN